MRLQSPLGFDFARQKCAGKQENTPNGVALPNSQDGSFRGIAKRTWPGCAHIFEWEPLAELDTDSLNFDGDRSTDGVAHGRMKLRVSQQIIQFVVGTSGLDVHANADLLIAG